MKSLFINPIRENKQLFLILLIATAFIFMPQPNTLNDWALNTDGLWDDILHTYEDPGRVYPPWAFILLLPIYAMRLAGVRFLSVITMAWLVKRQQWPFYVFFTIIFSPYFLFSILLGNFDILVLVFPVLLWQAAEDSRWKWIARGAALSLLVLKPQAGALIWLYLLWQKRKEWKAMLAPLGVVALIVVPISLIGRPPLLVQWINNLLNPSAANELYWDINNVSLTDLLQPHIAIGIVLLLSIGLYFYYQKKKLHWQENEFTTILLILPMLLSPYASQQGVSSSFAFVPTLGLTAAQYGFVLLGGLTEVKWLSQEPIRVLILAVLGILFYSISPLRSDSRTGQPTQDEE